MPDLGDQLADAFRSGWEMGHGAADEMSAALGSSGRMGVSSKLTKYEANYRPVEEDGNSDGHYWRRCGNCAHYSSHFQCEVVAGVIDPDDTCDEWEGPDDGDSGSEAGISDDGVLDDRRD